MREERLNSLDSSEEPETKLRDRFTETVSRLFRSNEVADEGAEEDNEKKKRRRRGKSARWRRFLRGVFGRTSEEDAGDRPEHRSSLMPFISLEHIPLSRSSEDVAEHTQTEAQHPGDQLPVSERTREAPAEAANPEDSGAGVENLAYETPEAVPPNSSEIGVEEQPQSPEAAPELPQEQQGVLYIDHTPDTDFQVRQLQQAAESLSSESAAAPEHSTTVDRTARGLAVGLAGMEYIGRKRADRKLARTKEQQAKESRDLSEKVAHQTAEMEDAKKRLAEQELRYKSAAQAEALKVKRSAEAHAAAKIEQPPKTADKKPMQRTYEASAPRSEWDNPLVTAPIELPSTAPERSPEVTKAKIQETANAQEELRRRSKELAKEAEYSQQVYEDAEKAAAHGVPVEKYYERRHEVKDDEAVASAVPIGSVLRDRQPLQRAAMAGAPVPTPHVPTPFSPSASPQPLATSGSPQQMYRQAAKNGFTTALVIIAAVIVMQLLR